MIITSVLLKWLPTIMEAARLPDVGSCDVILTIPRSYPSDAEPLDPRLVAFSLEGDRWPEWAGSRVGQPNRFTEQVLQNLYERTDFRPAVRVGADSEDRTHLDLSLHVGHAIYPPSTPEFPYPEAARITLGRDWFALSRNFANMTPFTWGLNFKSLNVTETRLQARLLAKTFGREGQRQAGSELWLEAVEIGNEPELYTRSVSGGGVPNPGNWTLWSVQNYTQTWSAYARAVAGEIDLGEETGTVLRVGDIQLAGPAGGWNPQSLMHAGLLDTDFNRKHVKIYSEHLYLAGFEPGHEAASGVLMDKTHIRNNLTLRARNIAAARKAGLSYVLGESSSYSGHGSPGTSNTAEAALWAIDYLLQAATLGVSRVYLSHGIGYRYSSFQPTASAINDGMGLARPHIMPLYYGLLVVNEVIGKSSHDRSVVEFRNVHPNLAAYGVYERQQLERIVIVNSQPYTGAGERGSIVVRLEGLRHRPVRIKRLDLPHTAATNGLFEDPSGKPRGILKEDAVPDSVINVKASSAVLLKLAGL